MMKSIACLVMVFLALTAAAQQDTVRLREISRQQHSIVTDRPPQAVYFQLGGSGPLLSVVYDRRLRNRVNGIGFGAGLGFWAESGTAIFSVPLQLNYLFGRSTHFIELGAGTTYITDSEDFFDESASGFIHHVNLGYRYQPTKGGFFFRGGFSPLFFGSEYATSFYLGFGHNF